MDGTLEVYSESMQEIEPLILQMCQKFWLAKCREILGDETAIPESVAYYLKLGKQQATKDKTDRETLQK